MSYLGTYAATAPDRPAVIMASSGESLSYGQLFARSNRLARLLWDAGLRIGDHYAILAENHIRYFEAVWAGLNAGLYVTAINSHLTAEEAAYIVNDSGSKVLITTTALADVAEAIAPLTPNVGRRLMIGGASPAYEHYEEAIGSYAAEPLGPQRRGTFMLYSSGTTGRPKGVKFPLPDWNAQVGEPAFVAQVASMCALAGDGHDVYLSPAPLYHAAPLRASVSVHCLGGTVVVLGRFDALEALRAIERYGVTSSQWVPTMFVRMLKLDEADRNRFDLSSLRVAVHAAAPCPVEVKQRMIDWWGPILIEYYSGTENIGSTAITSEEWLSHKGSVGRPVGSASVHICDERGEELAVGEDGLVYFDFPLTSFEYHRDAEKTSSARHPRNPAWRTLGDIGHVDEDGYLYLADRQAFMIIAGGVNIYPQEIEDVLVMHPRVVDTAVIGVPNPDIGEEVKAVVQPGEMPDDPAALEAELIAYCRRHLAAFKCPRSVDFVEQLPRLDNGKLYKRKLRDAYWARTSARQAE